MLPREALIKKHETGNHIGWRSHEISRIEGLSDAVFAFAVTLLVVSLEVPRTFAELTETMHGFLPFAISFAILFQIWYAQFLWFRRYGLQDTITILLNSVLLFVVLFYVYPLKFLFTYLLNVWTGGKGMTRLPNGHMEPMMAGPDGARMMMIYDAGFIAVFTVFVLLYLHAWRRKDALDLSPDERFETVAQIGRNLCFVAIGMISLLMVIIGGDEFSGWAGLAFFLIAPVLTVYYSVLGARKRKRMGK